MHLNETHRRSVIEFTKMSGAGNDFIVIDNRFYHFSNTELSELARRLCARRKGIGADGLLALAADESGDVDFLMVYYNADGSRGSMCGNGARCLGRFARSTGIEGPEMIFDSDAGRYRIIVPENNLNDIRLYVPGYSDYRRGVELECRPETGKFDADYLWTGTEHLVCWVDDVSTTDVQSLGLLLRSDPSLAPPGVNVDFAEYVYGNKAKPGTEPTVRVRTFEKGVEEETLACGTGAIAVSLSGLLRGIIHSNPVAIEMPGGRLIVGFEGSVERPENLYLEGPAEIIYRGTVEP